MIPAAESYEMSVNVYRTTLARKQQISTYIYLLYICTYTAYLHTYIGASASARARARTQTHTRAEYIIPVQGPVLIPQHRYDS